MRLTQIKLAGFKSFVDPTTIPTPGELVGIVGPNGCGKSNIIDAVRWVLGESRAAELRGATMQDVIFNGSGQRKPAARASVELTFDNSAGRAGGAWSKYAEIVVRRVLTRDGASRYFINQQGVRRRDVHDIFLGTGLGARGYAIIGQGMINRLIEARPEDLRVMLEEAAGVSRYKERRRETEARLRDARDNLARLEDLLHELTAQLARLRVQAEQARRYRDLQAEHDFKQQALWLLRERAARTNQRALAVDIEQAEGRLQKANEAWQSLEATLDALRAAHLQAADDVHQAQGRLLEAEARVSRLQAEIRHFAETGDRLRARRNQLQAQLQEWGGQQGDAQSALAAIEDDIRAAEACAQQQARAVALAQTRLHACEAQLQTLQQRRDAVRQAAAAVRQDAALLAQRRRDLAGRLQALVARVARQRNELQALAPPDEAAPRQRAARVAQLRQQRDQAQAALARVETDHAAALQAREAAQRQALARQDAVQRHQAQRDALQELQDRVQAQGRLRAWLQQNGWAGRPALWQRIDVDAGWEIALEAVLGQRLGALQEPSLDDLLIRVAGAPPPARIDFYQAAGGRRRFTRATPRAAARPLRDHVRVDDADLQAILDDWLDGTYVAADLQAAVAQRAQLPSGGQWVVPEGHRVDARGVYFYARDREEAGLLERRGQIARLSAALDQRLEEARQAQAELDQAEALVAARTAAQREARGLLAQAQDAWQQAEIEYREWCQARTRDEEQRQRLAQALQEAEVQRADLARRQTQAAERAADLDRERDRQQTQEGQADQALRAARDELDQARAQLRADERASQDAGYAVRTLHHRVEELQRTMQLARDQLKRSGAELEAVQGELFTLDASDAETQLQQAGADRAACETALRAARERQDERAGALRRADERRLLLQRDLDPLQAQINALRLKEQAERLTAEQFATELDNRRVDRATLNERLQAQGESFQQVAWLRTQVQRVAQRMESLGAVNLAALDELQAAQERQVYVESQHGDLQRAIGTLEDAIRRIDRETRALLSQTFDAVNGHFADLFPRLFGGGQAHLAMTGDEILDAGVQVLAQPPGKRNSSIQLLSGGEKALTATALVFALFKLNPAPFCLLDEVDAPLDDANTDRLVSLVRGMSDQTQFLFISHNKIAMQMARQLVGVTMQEQGVSRIVAVDMDAALQLAAQAA